MINRPSAINEMVYLRRGAAQNLGQDNVQVGDHPRVMKGPGYGFPCQFALVAGDGVAGRAGSCEKVQAACAGLEAFPGEQACPVSRSQEVTGLFPHLAQAGGERVFARFDPSANAVPEPAIGRVKALEKEDLAGAGEEAEGVDWVRGGGGQWV